MRRVGGEGSARGRWRRVGHCWVGCGERNKNQKQGAWCGAVAARLLALYEYTRCMNVNDIANTGTQEASVRKGRCPCRFQRQLFWRRRAACEVSRGYCVEEKHSPGAITSACIEDLINTVRSLEADCTHHAARERARRAHWATRSRLDVARGRLDVDLFELAERLKSIGDVLGQIEAHRPLEPFLSGKTRHLTHAIDARRSFFLFFFNQRPDRSSRAA